MKKIMKAIKPLSSQTGVSIIGAIFILIILSIFGIAILTLVAGEHESRSGHVSSMTAFYCWQAGIEYGLRQVMQAEYPIVTNKQFDKGTFTVQVDYNGSTRRHLRVTGASGAAQKRYEISWPQFAGDCVERLATPTPICGSGADNIWLRQLTCRVGPLVNGVNCANPPPSRPVNIDRIQLTWTPNNNENVREVWIGGVQLYNDAVGVPSGTIIDLTDKRITNMNNWLVEVKFSSTICAKSSMIVRLIFTDGSFFTTTFSIT